jgi:ubiquinone/menaquinone biosynthesis C-methylase UbiE
MNSIQSDQKSSEKSVSYLLSQMHLGEDGIYGYSFSNAEQAMEIELRDRVAALKYDDPLAKVALNHSVPVMDHEVARFLGNIPEKGRVIDVGGCWGWHWRNIHRIRPDIRVYIVDFSRGNLLQARALLGNAINDSIFLIHGDATDLRFPDSAFDGYWSVQTLQHVIRFDLAISEARRVLRPNGIFANYSFNDQPPIRWLYRALRKNYHIRGYMEGSFWLERASDAQRRIVESTFNTIVDVRWSEILFKPEFHLTFSGKEHSLLGKIDGYLSNCFGALWFVARQCSYHCTKEVPDMPPIRNSKS